MATTDMEQKIVDFEQLGRRFSKSKIKRGDKRALAAIVPEEDYLEAFGQSDMPVPEFDPPPGPHNHALCPICDGLVDAHGNCLNQPLLSVTCGLVRPIASGDGYELLLQRETDDKGNAVYALPNTLVRVGEQGAAAAARCVFEFSGIRCARPAVVSLHGMPQRQVDAHVVTMLYVSMADTRARVENPNTSSGNYVGFYDVNMLVQQTAKFPMKHDHRELMYMLNGFVRTKAKLGLLNQLFYYSKPEVVTCILNPLFGSSLASNLDKAVVAYNNPYFESGILKPTAKSKKADNKQLSPRSDNKAMADEPAIAVATDETDINPNEVDQDAAQLMQQQRQRRLSERKARAEAHGDTQPTSPRPFTETNGNAPAAAMDSPPPPPPPPIAPAAVPVSPARQPVAPPPPPATPGGGVPLTPVSAWPAEPAGGRGSFSANGAVGRGSTVSVSAAATAAAAAAAVAGMSSPLNGRAHYNGNGHSSTGNGNGNGVDGFGSGNNNNNNNNSSVGLDYDNDDDDDDVVIALRRVRAMAGPSNGSGNGDDGENTLNVPDDAADDDIFGEDMHADFTNPLARMQ